MGRIDAAYVLEALICAAIESDAAVAVPIVPVSLVPYDVLTCCVSPDDSRAWKNAYLLAVTCYRAGCIEFAMSY